MGKAYMGKCISCQQHTMLARGMDMCGPCITGDADTAWPLGEDADIIDDLAVPDAKPPKVKCPICGKMTGGLHQHVEAKHPETKCEEVTRG